MNMVGASENKGRNGEEYILKLLDQLPKEEYRVIHNLILRQKNVTDHNPFVQIDFVVVSCYGIFVIEVKNYDGYIGGGENNSQWHHYVNCQHYLAPNPVRQNTFHTNVLRQFLGIVQSNAIKPVVVFLNGVKLGIDYVNSVVLKANQLIEYITSFKRECFTKTKVGLMTDILEKEKENNQGWGNAQIKICQRDKEIYDNKIQHFICPRCGGDLKVIRGKSGIFYGCSNYPDCQYSAPIKESYM